MIHEGGALNPQELERLIEHATRDSLSGLLNREAAISAINDYLKNKAPEDGCALYMVDLDHFKEVNDTLGHQAGDQLITRSAREISRVFRASDILARIGGDEFIAFMGGVSSADVIRRKATALCDMLQFSVGDTHALQLSASVGVCFACKGNPSFNEMYAKADEALYKAKNSGRNQCCLTDYSASPAGKRDASVVPQVSAVQLQTLLEYMDAGVELIRVGNDIRLIYVSPSYYRLMNEKPSTLPLPCALSETSIHPDDLGEYERVLRAGAASGETVEHMHRSVTGDNACRWMHVRAIRLQHAGDCPVMLAVVTDITEFKNKNDQLRSGRERLRIAFEQTSRVLWEVDIATRTFGIFNIETHDFEPGTMLRDFPEAYVRGGWVHPDSAEKFRAFAQELLSGSAQGGGAFILRYKSGCYGWASLSYHMLYDAQGKPVKAIGIEENLPNIAGAQTSFAQERRLLEALRANLIVSMAVNLSTGHVEGLWAEGKNLTGIERYSRFEAVCEMEAARLFLPGEDGEAFRAHFSREALLDAFMDGKTWISMEYRRVNGGGGVRWAACALRLFENPVTRDIYAFVFIRDVEQRHRWESFLEGRVRRDASTGLYDEASARALAVRLTREFPGALCALAAIRFAGMERLRNMGGGRIELCWYYLATAFGALLDSDAIVGARGGDGMLVFFPRIASENEMARRLEEIFEAVRQTLKDMDPVRQLRFIAGVASARTDGAEYDDMLSQADYACALRMEAPADAVELARRARGPLETLAGDKDDMLVANAAQPDQPLAGEEKSALLACASAMLAANRETESMAGALACLGRYYQADRAYILTLAQPGGIVIAHSEWAGEGKRRLANSITGTALERFPLLACCMERERPMMMRRKRRPGEKGETEWRYIVSPFNADGGKGFLCLENPRAHADEAALLSAAIPMMLHDLQKYAAGRAGVSQRRDALTHMLNLHAYTELLPTFTPSRYSSLGALSAGIVGLDVVNAERGVEYGSKLLVLVAEQIGGAFANAAAFRMSGSRFLALCPDCTRAAFDERCERVRAVLSRRLGERFSMGRAWASGGFSAGKLAREAEDKRLRGAPGSAETLFRLGDETFASASEAIAKERFTVWLQPVFGLENGSQQGAEVLVRGLNGNDRVVSPAEFIGQLEHGSLIRELDFFVLEKALALLEKWGGERDMRLSVNFSRVTLADVSALASVLAIHSRYPGVPADRVEIEVTETADGIDGEAFEKVMERFREMGYRFALDGLGARNAGIAMLSDLKFDAVKLDSSLACGMAATEAGNALVKNLVDFCRRGGMECVAKGVETRDQAQRLADTGCEMAQGYFYDRPMPVEAFERKFLGEKKKEDEP